MQRMTGFHSHSGFVIGHSRQGMASVAGLAPARSGMKVQALELLCIHGRREQLRDWVES